MKKEDMKSIHEKLDSLNNQISGITSRLKRFDDLKEDLALISNDAFGEVIKFLGDVDFHYRSGDFLFLIKKFLINVRNISKMMDQLQSLSELMEDVSPLAKEILYEIIEKLHKLEHDGLFQYLESFKKVFIKFNESFSPEDVGAMGEGMVRLLKIASRLNKPEYLDRLEKITDTIETMELKKEERVSMFKIFKKMRRKKVLQNAALALDFIEAVSK